MMFSLFRETKKASLYSHHAYNPVRISEDESEEGLLERNQPGATSIKPRTHFLRRNACLILGQIVFVLLYTAALYLLVAKTKLSSISGSRSVSWSPAARAVEWEERKFVLGDRIQEKGKYSGRPSPSVDKAWHDLLNDENIRIESDIIHKLGREDISVKVPGEEYYIGTLNVYHELHCLKRLHQYMYQDIYFPHINDRQREMNRLHNEHCIDFLRQAAICHGDVGLITYEWSPVDRIPIANATTHQCVNWSKLEKWTSDRTVDMMKPNWLVHPTLGLAYPHGEGDNIGAANAGHNHSD